MNERPFDLIVLGVGMAGLTAAQTCAAAGWSVAVVDHQPYGGTCALRGCDPKKLLRRGAELMDGASALSGKGFDLKTGQINWTDLMAHKRSFTEPMPAKIERALERAGVVRLHGAARLLHLDDVQVNDSNIRTRHVLVATGAKPRPLDFPGAEHLIDSTAFLNLDVLPRRIVFVGGGYVSMEFAHIVCRAGVRATVIDHGERILKAFDPDLTERLTERSRQAGIEIRLGTAIRRVEPRGDAFRIATDQDTLDCDLVVHGAGRTADIDELGLREAGVESTSKGVRVNEFLQSVSSPTVYAAGDAADTPGLPLTPVAVAEGHAVASNLLEGNHRSPDYAGTPSVAFTIPEIARLGLSEAEARSSDRRARVVFNDTAGWYSQRRVGETHSATKLIVDETTDQIVGAHLLGHGYAEVVNVFALAMQTGLTVKQLKLWRSAYPTAGSDVSSMV